MKLTIGVTGHRNLVAAEVPALREQVRAFFEALAREYPGLELQVITPLAEGADRLVAQGGPGTRHSARRAIADAAGGIRAGFLRHRLGARIP